MGVDKQARGERGAGAQARGHGRGVRAAREEPARLERTVPQESGESGRTGDALERPRRRKKATADSIPPELAEALREAERDPARRVGGEDGRCASLTRWKRDRPPGTQRTKINRRIRWQYKRLIQRYCKACGALPVSAGSVRCEPCLEVERVAARKRRRLFAWKSAQLVNPNAAPKQPRRVCLCHGLVNPPGDDHRYAALAS